MSVLTPYSYRTYSGNGMTRDFAVSFPYIVKAHVRVYINWNPDTGVFESEVEPGTGFDWITDTAIRLTVAPPAGKTVSVVRTTPINQRVTEWQAGSPPTAAELTAADEQVLFVVQEFIDRVAIFQGATTGGGGGAVSVNTLNFIQAGTGAIIRSLDSKLKDLVSYNDFSALGHAARINQALAVGNMAYVPRGNYVLEGNVTPTSSGLLIDPATTFSDYSRLRPRGAFSDVGGGVNAWRFQDRVFVGGAVAVTSGSRPVVDGFDIAGDPVGLGSDYLERGAAFLASNAFGGIGGTFATKQSRQYSSVGYSVWASGEAVTVGAKRGYYEKLYTATTSGTTGSTPPNHTVGTASDGGVTWQFDRFTYMASIGLAAVADADVADGHGCWAAYIEGVRRPAGGTLLTTELVVKNKGSLVVNNPYNIMPGGATIGLWMPGGGDATLGPPANPSTCAIAIGRNAATWTRGIVFTSDSLTAEGVAVALAKDHYLAWFAPDESRKADISSIRTSGAAGKSFIQFQDGGVWIGQSDAAGLVVESAAADNSYVRAVAGTGVARLITGSGAANADLQLGAKGAGKIDLASPLQFSYSGFTVAATPGNFTADRYMVVYNSGVPFYIPARLATW